MIRFFRLAILSGLLGLTLSACSLAGYGYELAPWWLNRQLSSYVTFSASQQAMVDQDLDALHEWHRKTQLPVYVAFLEKVSDRWSVENDRPGEAELSAWRDELIQAWRNLAKQMAPGLARIMVTLTPSQLDQIEAEFRERAKSNQEDIQTDPNSTAEQKFNARVDRWVSRGESFFGSITEVQHARLAHRVRNAPEVSAWWLEREKHRTKVIELFRSIASEKPEPAVATERVYQSLINYGRPTTEAMKKLSEATRNTSRAAAAELFASTSAAQVEHLQSELAGYISILRGVRGFAAAGT
jgi:hypothetical protein